MAAGATVLGVVKQVCRARRAGIACLCISARGDAIGLLASVADVRVGLIRRGIGQAENLAARKRAQGAT